MPCFLDVPQSFTDNGEVDGPIDDADGDLDGEGGGKAREGSLAIGRNDLGGVLVPLDGVFVYINLE